MSFAALPLPSIFITHDNHRRLTGLVQHLSTGRRAHVAQPLERELERAELIDVRALTPDIVTMGSRVIFEVLETGRWNDAELVWPHQDDAELGRLSVLAPEGPAVLGLAEGQSIQWPMPDAQTRTLRVRRVVYQPETATRAVLLAVPANLEKE